MFKVKCFLLVALVFVCSQNDASAWPSRRSNNTVSNYSSYSGGDTSTAQGVAEIQARRGSVAHFGGNRGYEGCGSGSTPEAALANCCYSRSGMTVVDMGTAYGHGRWFACKRYR